MFSATTKEAADATVNDAKATAYGAKRDLRNETADAESEFEQAAHRAGRKVRNFIDDANDEFNDVTDRLSGEIRSNPLRSAGLAMGLGVILGMLIRR